MVRGKPGTVWSDKVACITRVILCRRPQMEVNEFKDMAKEMVDYIGGYLENIRDR